MALQLLALRGLALTCPAFCLVLAACDPAQPAALPADLALGRRYAEDVGFRRAMLERSLADRDNGYARLRLDNYALAERWERLPEQHPRVLLPGSGDTEPLALFAEEVPWTRPALLDLGRTAFETWPAQRHPQLSAVIDDPELGEQLGFARDRSGRPAALVIARFPDGSEQPSLTCATCHARIEGGELVHGKASSIDLAAVLARDGGGNPGWGPGRIDVTTDGSDNPVAIPDLRAVRHQRRLHWTGNLENGLIELAIRIETLLITASGEVVRPPRQVAFALALYLWSLGEGERPSAGNTGAGAQLFMDQCGDCHSGATGEGDPVEAAEVGTDPAAARSPDRGTGRYRVPSLWRAGERAQLTHEGRFAELEALLDPERAASDAAHPFGLSLTSAERADLIDYLRSL